MSKFEECEIDYFIGGEEVKIKEGLFYSNPKNGINIGSKSILNEIRKRIYSELGVNGEANTDEWKIYSDYMSWSLSIINEGVIANSGKVLSVCCERLPEENKERIIKRLERLCIHFELPFARENVIIR